MNNENVVDRKQKLISLAQRFSQLCHQDGYLITYEKMLHKYGLKVAVYFAILIDKFHHFAERTNSEGSSMLQEDGSFYFVHSDQKKQTKMSSYQLRKCKNELIKERFLKTEMRKGIPPREWYLIDPDRVIDFFRR